MATTKIWKIVKRLDHVVDYAEDKNKTKNDIEFKVGKQNYQIITNDLSNVLDYAMNKDKTEKQYYVTGINCESDSAYEEMKDTKLYFNKQDGILGFHAYQSFVKGEVTPELAHKIGVELTNEIWGDRFQVVVTTHLNTEHIHNHFVINSVSFVDGKRYYDNHTTYSKIRHVSDELCKEYGLNVLKEKPTKSNLKYNNFYKKSLYNDTYSKNAKRDIDLAIRQAYSYEDFLYLMKKLDYSVIVRSGKLSVRKNTYKRNIRIERRYGEDYTIENIKKRIIEEQSIRVPFVENVYSRKVNYPFASRHKIAKAKGFIALYYHYCYLLKIFPDNIPQQKLPASMRADVSRLEELSNEAKFLSNNKIKNLDDLINYKDELNFKINDLSNNRERLWAKRKLLNDENERLKISKEISSFTSKIDKLREEGRLCDDIKIRSQTIDNNLTELDNQVEEEKEQKKNKEKEKSKN